MPTVDFCQDGLFIRVSAGNDSRDMVLSLQDPAHHFETEFPCHLDELLAVAHGLTFQAGNPDGHILIATDGSTVCMRFALVQGGTRSCNVEKKEFEQALMLLKSEGNT
jgi:hypothetical protein